LPGCFHRCDVGFKRPSGHEHIGCFHNEINIRFEQIPVLIRIGMTWIIDLFEWTWVLDNLLDLNLKIFLKFATIGLEPITTILRR
jgi:hypothetical protein